VSGRGEGPPFDQRAAQAGRMRGGDESILKPRSFQVGKTKGSREIFPFVIGYCLQHERVKVSLLDRSRLELSVENAFNAGIPTTTGSRQCELSSGDSGVTVSLPPFCGGTAGRIDHNPFPAYISSLRAPNAQSSGRRYSHAPEL
jgi:hypothetical protein